ncbi:MAG TPA: Fic/DOC family N-terminal domain-containing protein, partial [Nitrospira sp.]|nr:Fic/DOC family N-terminal domain-containing protein [Nitrospira sp.]
MPDKLPIKDVNWEPLIPAIGKANRAIALYEGFLHTIPAANVMLAPLTTQEAVLSSSIEGTQATLGDVLKFDAGERTEHGERKQDIWEIINYRNALRAAEAELKERPFNLNMLRRLHGTLLSSVRGHDKRPGEFRTTQNHVGKPNTPISEAFFVPPSPIGLMDHLSDWEKYYHAERPDALVQLAVVYAPFEILHPVNDGNGRLGRIIIPLFFFDKKLLTNPMFYMSSWL